MANPTSSEIFCRAEAKHPRPWRGRPDGENFAWLVDANGKEVASLLVPEGGAADALTLTTTLAEAVNALEFEAEAEANTEVPRPPEPVVARHSNLAPGAPFQEHEPRRYMYAAERDFFSEREGRAL